MSDAMSDHEVIRTAIITQLTSSSDQYHPALLSGVSIFPIDNRQDYDVKLRKFPAIGVGYASRKWSPHMKAIGMKVQNVDWSWELYYCAAGPGKAVAAGLDVLALMHAGVICLRGLEFPSIVAGVVPQVVGGHMNTVDEVILDVLPGALLYVQRWTLFQQGKEVIP